MINELKGWAKARGYEIAWGPAPVIKDVQSEFRQLKETGDLDPTFYKNQLSWFDLKDRYPSQNSKSVIMIAVPRPAHRLVFELNDNRLETILPPTYLLYDETREGVYQDLTSSVFKNQGCVSILQAPLKATAARLGLVRYGRNNITYIPGMGSYFQLVGVITDMELPNPPTVSKMAESCQQCKTCKACINACPTGAISESRFLIRAECCFVLYNETPGHWPHSFFPYLAKCFSTQSCLIGCLLCQLPCPLNKGLLKTEDAEVSFTAKETEGIIAEDYLKPGYMENRIMDKINRIGLNEYTVLGRNLRVLMEYHQGRES